MKKIKFAIGTLTFIVTLLTLHIWAKQAAAAFYYSKPTVTQCYAGTATSGTKLPCVCVGSSCKLTGSGAMGTPIEPPADVADQILFPDFDLLFQGNQEFIQFDGPLSDSFLQHLPTRDPLHLIGAPVQNQSYTYELYLPPSAVPEPATLVLLGSGLGGLFVWRLCKRRRDN